MRIREDSARDAGAYSYDARATMTDGAPETGSFPRQTIHVLAPVFGPGLLALVGTSLIHGRIDLSDLPGPASGQLISSLALVDPGQPTSALVRMLVAWIDLCPLPLLGDLRLLLGPMVSMAAAMGAALAGHALAGGGSLGRRAAWTCGLAMSCGAPLVESSTWIALEPLSIGLALLGLGIAMSASSGPTRWLPLVLPGVAAVLLAGEVREVGLPFRALLAVLPLLAWRRPLRAAMLILLVGWALVEGPGLVSGWAGEARGGGRHTHEAVVTLSAARQGLGELLGLLAPPVGGRVSVFLPLAVLALPAALLPGPRWAARLGFASLTLLATGMTVEALDPGWLRLRYLAEGTTGLVMLSGLSAAGLGHLLARRGWAALLPSGALIALLATDSLDALWQSARERAPYTGISLPRLPDPGRLPIFLNGRAMGTSPHALSVDRAVDLWEVATPGGGPIAATPLQDERGAQIVAVAALMGSPAFLLRPERCCAPGQGIEACANGLLTELDEAGVDLLLPRGNARDWRYSGQDPLAPVLRLRAVERGSTLTGDLSWTRVRARGSAEGSVCQLRVPEVRDPRPTPRALRQGRWWATTE